MRNNTNPTLLLNLIHYPMHAKPQFAVKLKTSAKTYPELDLFRQQIQIHRVEEHQPYSSAKNKVFAYRCIFLALGVLFGMLAAMVLFSTTSYPLFFNMGVFLTARNLTAVLSCVLSIAAFGIAGILRSEREAAYHLLRKAKYKLTKSMTQKQVHFGLIEALPFGSKYKQSVSLRQSYHDAQDKIHDHYDELHHLFERITKSPTVAESTREHLFNQALLEFNEKIIQVVHLFRQQA